MTTSSAQTRPLNPPLLQFHRVSRFFKPDKPALFDLSFQLNAGDFLYVTGTSGAGKSTLLKLIHLTEPPDTGAILVNGHDVAKLKKSAISVLRRSIGIIFQDFRLIPDLTVAANVGLPLEVLGASSSRIRKRVFEVLEEVGLEHLEKEKAGVLSGGEQQRVAIARALVARPQMILADEPTGSLDAYNANFILDMLERIHATGTTVIVATHDRMLMSARPHPTMTLDSGRLIHAMRSSETAACESPQPSPSKGPNGEGRGHD